MPVKPIKLIPGEHNSVSIEDRAGNTLYKKQGISQKELKAFMQKNGKSWQGWSLIQGALMPLRTRNAKDFAQDLFLPTVIHYALTVNDFALGVLACIGACALDVVTFPFRFVVATPIRVGYNYLNSEAEHPIIKLIKGSPHAQRALDDNFVNLCSEQETVVFSPASAPDKRGDTFQKATQSIVSESVRIALRTMPGGTWNESAKAQEHRVYNKVNKKGWVVDGTSKDKSKHSSFAC